MLKISLCWNEDCYFMLVKKNYGSICWQTNRISKLSSSSALITMLCCITIKCYPLFQEVSTLLDFHFHASLLPAGIKKNVPSKQEKNITRLIYACMIDQNIDWDEN